MKKLLFLLTIFFSLIVTAQETTNQANFEEEDIEKSAEFPGGPNAFLQTVLKNFRIRKVNGSGIMKTQITFIVGKDGAISDIKANGENESFNKEAEHAVSKIKTQWQAGKVNEEIVRSRFRFPLTLTFK